MEPYYADDKVSLYCGDSLEVLGQMPDDCMDSIVTDPPAGISFMGKAWDSDKGGRDQWIIWLADIMREALRVLKPGGHALVWAIPRTSHWTATALENAGFEIHDIAHHLFGDGFPKSLNVSKAIDKAAGVEREIVGPGSSGCPYLRRGEPCPGHGAEVALRAPTVHVPETAPVTDAAKEWEGWGTALKPAVEHWILARKPLAEKSVGANVQTWRTGAIHIDACRIGSALLPAQRRGQSGVLSFASGGETPDRIGRHPSNLLLRHKRECVKVGERKVRGVKSRPRSPDSGGVTWNLRRKEGVQVGHADEEGLETVDIWACVPGCLVRALDYQGEWHRPLVLDKSGQKARTEGKWTGFWKRERDYIEYLDSGVISRYFYCSNASPDERHGSQHPTVKPLALMRWLVRLVTPPGGCVLDPFAGTASTLEAAAVEGFDVIGIELDEQYCEDASVRLIHAAKERQGADVQ